MVTVTFIWVFSCLHRKNNTQNCVWEKKYENNFKCMDKHMYSHFRINYWHKSFTPQYPHQSCDLYWVSIVLEATVKTRVNEAQTWLNPRISCAPIDPIFKNSTNKYRHWNNNLDTWFQNICYLGCIPQGEIDILKSSCGYCNL